MQSETWYSPAWQTVQGLHISSAVELPVQSVSSRHLLAGQMRDVQIVSHVITSEVVVPSQVPVLTRFPSHESLHFWHWVFCLARHVPGTRW